MRKSSRKHTADLSKHEAGNRKGQRKTKIINRTLEQLIPNTEAKTRFDKRHRIHKQNTIRYYGRRGCNINK